jgi:arylsulfatase A-like enzyme
MSPHDPYDPEAELIQDGYQGRLNAHHFAPHDEFPSEMDFRGKNFLLTQQDKEHIHYLYKKEVEQLDSQLEELFKKIQDLELRENTVIVLTSDHGEEFWEHGDYYHGQSLFEELTAVPLVFLIPDLESHRISGLVEIIDIVPTLKELCGVSETSDVDGKSLVDVIRDRSEPQSPVFSVLHHRYLYALRYNEYTVMWNALTNETFLYNRKNDPYELREVTDKDPEMMNQFLDMIKLNYNKLRSLSQKTPEDEAKRKEIEKRLRSLGYIK